MSIKKKLFILLVIISSSFAANAQRTDVGIMLGGSYYYGDVVNGLDLNSIGPSFFGFLRYRLGERVALRANVGYVKVSGDDANSSSEWQVARNWNFQTPIIEGSLVGEFNFKADRNKGRRFANPFIPYVFAGVGFFNFTPQTEFNGAFIQTAPLALSGKTYSTSAICVPFGGGFRYYLAKNFQLGFELGIRYTTTSYIDDIAPDDRYVDPSTTPDPSTTAAIYARSASEKNVGDFRSKMGAPKDSYGSGIVNKVLQGSDFYFAYGITAAFTLGKVSGGGGGGRGRAPMGKAIRCPRFY